MGDRGGVAYNDRTLVLGSSGWGKSVLLNQQFSAMRCQRLLVDTKDEWAIDGVERVPTVDALDWSAPVIHYCPFDNDLAEFSRLFDLALRRRNLVVCVHELGDLCDYRAHATPPGVRSYLSKGRAHGLGLLGASQRPVEMPKRALTEAVHFFILVPRMSEADLGAIAQELDMPTATLAAHVDQVHKEHGDYSFLWYDRRTRKLVACKPLDASAQRNSIVRKRTVA